MNTDADNLKSFIEKIRSLNFLQRLYKWSIRIILIDAAPNDVEMEVISKEIVIEDMSDGLNKVKL